MIITVPEGWADVTLSQFQSIAAADDARGLGVLDQAMLRVSAVTSVPVEELMTMTPEAMGAVAEALSWMSETPLPVEFDRTITVDGVELGLEPRLNRLTLGAWADLEHYVTDDLVGNLHQVMSVLYRPVTMRDGDLYEVEPYDGAACMARAEAVAEAATVGQVYGASVFFCHFARAYTGFTSPSSQEEPR